MKPAGTLRRWSQYFWFCSILLTTAPQVALAQEITISLGEGDSLSERVIQLFVLITLLSLAPALAMMVTSFPFMVTVLAILRQGLGLQQSPPNMLIVSLALFLTYFVMEPVFLEAWSQGIKPSIDGAIPLEQGARLAFEPFHRFMLSRTDTGTLAVLTDLRNPGIPSEEATASFSVLIPSFLLSEIERAFQIGFLIFLPFLIIDLVVAAVLMSMGMMMVPPVIVSLPFKLAFFVVADGWALLTGALVRSYF